MKLKKYAAPIAAFSAGALLLAACGDGNGNGDPVETDETTTEPIEGEEPAGIADDEIFYTGGSQEWQGYNSQASTFWNVATSTVNSRTSSGFIHFGPDGTIQQDLEFGDFEIVNEDPLSVKYTVNDNVVWSDGNAIDYADALLDWASQNPEFRDRSWDPDTAGPNGDGIKEDGEPFTEADRPRVFQSVSATLGTYVPEPPEGEIGGREFTYNFDPIYADWQLLVSGFLPAHVVAEGIGITEDELAQAILDGDLDVVDEIAEFWNTGWSNPSPGEFPDASLIPTSGPYVYDEWVPGQYITLVANENYWGTPAATNKLTFRFVDDAATTQALDNGDVDVINPQASVDTLANLERMEGVQIAAGDTLTWEHVDFNHRAGIFSGNLAAREALAYCIPRQQIVDNLVKPINPEARVMNAREVFPFQPGYDEYVSEIYDGRYDEVNLDLAREKFAEAGLAEGTDVVFLFVAGNQRRADTVSAIKTSCDQVGFNIVADPMPGDEAYSLRLNQIAGAHYDVSLFAWAGSGQKASGRNIYRSDALPMGGQNMNHYSNAEVDAAWDTLAATVDETVHREQLPIIEKHLWDDLHGMPLYAHPGLAGYDETIQNVIFTSTQDQIVWNAHQWVR